FTLIFDAVFNVGILALGAAISPQMAPAQEGINYASVSGRVTDASGGIVRSAQVTARQTETNLSSTLFTDNDGRFRFPYLRVGRYEIRVQATGFADAVRPVTVTPGSAFDLPIALAVASAETNLTVHADSVILETARSEVAGTVSRAELSELPLN